VLFHSSRLTHRRRSIPKAVGQCLVYFPQQKIYSHNSSSIPIIVGLFIEG
jgi:hypothetical protein